MKKKDTKVCFISSAGGHWEQIRQLGKVAEKYEHYYVLPMNASTKKFEKKKYLVSDYSKGNKLSYCVHFVMSAAQQLFVFFKENPDVVITTGARLAIPTCLYARVFHKKVIYIESFARINSTNRTGNMIYKFADLFVVQWEGLLQFYPKAVYGGWIY